jgi:hypothetical protein
MFSLYLVLHNLSKRSLLKDSQKKLLATEFTFYFVRSTMVDRADDRAAATLAGMNGNSGGVPRTTSEGDSLRDAKRKRCADEHVFTVQPHVIQVIKKPRTFMNHSYRDFSCVPADAKEADLPTAIEDMSFTQKVHHILAQDEYTKWISWMPHGRAFRVSTYMTYLFLPMPECQLTIPPMIFLQVFLWRLRKASARNILATSDTPVSSVS